MTWRAIAALVLIAAAAAADERARPVAVRAAAETEPVPGNGDAADDVCIRVDPDDEARSVVIGTDKRAGALLVYDLDGREIARLATGRVNNVDLREGFRLGGAEVTLVTASDRTHDTIAAFVFDPAERALRPAGAVATSIAVYGLCMYESARDGAFHVFVNSKRGEVEQWRLDGASGEVRGTRVRAFRVGHRIVEGCVADDERGWVYVAEEARAIWRYPAEPDGGEARHRVDAVGEGRRHSGDIEGLALYRTAGGGGFLVASCQGDDAFAVYERGGDNAYVGSFRIVAGDVDGVSGTDGIEATSAPLGPAYPRGLLVAQDADNEPEGRQNFKLVPWDRIAAALDLPPR